MKAQSGDEWVAGIERARERDFAKHQIRDRGDTWWEIGEPGSSFFLARFVLPGLSRVIIIGDGPDLILQSSYRSPEGAVRWLAESGLDYLATKVVSGAGKQWEPEIALFDLDAYSAELAEDAGSPEEWEEPDWIDEARDGLVSDEWNQERLRAFVTDETDDFEIAENWGEVPSDDLITMRHAARVLVRLLDAETTSRGGEAA